MRNSTDTDISFDWDFEYKFILKCLNPFTMDLILMKLLENLIF